MERESSVRQSHPPLPPISKSPTITLNYRAQSALATGSNGATLALSALSEGRDEPFFQGRIRQTARALACVSRVVSERWFDAAAIAEARRRMLDPLVTSGDGVLRFEGFSGCRSLYVRLDMLPESVEIVNQSSGTANVDFNQPMRAALARIRDSDALSSIPSIASRCEVVAELSGAPLLDLFRNLPRSGNGRDTHWLQPAGNGVRVARTPSKEGIRPSAPSISTRPVADCSMANRKASRPLS